VPCSHCPAATDDGLQAPAAEPTCAAILPQREYGSCPCHQRASVTLRHRLAHGPLADLSQLGRSQQVALHSSAVRQVATTLRTPRHAQRRSRGPSHVRFSPVGGAESRTSPPSRYLFGRASSRTRGHTRRHGSRDLARRVFDGSPSHGSATC
jgi:hypothetical protein